MYGQGSGALARAGPLSLAGRHAPGRASRRARITREWERNPSMKGIPTLSLKRLKRTAAVAGVGALLVGGALLGTSQANAAVAQIGTGTGLTLAPATGAAGSAATTTPTFQST